MFEKSPNAIDPQGRSETLMFHCLVLLIWLKLKMRWMSVEVEGASKYTVEKHSVNFILFIYSQTNCVVQCCHHKLLALDWKFLPL